MTRARIAIVGGGLAGLYAASLLEQHGVHDYVLLEARGDLGHALGMRVICEGIETEAQEELLRAVGCEYGQGFLYGRPMQRADFEAFLRAHA